MLRWALLLIGLALTVAGLVFLITDGAHCGRPFLIWGLVLIITVLCERWRYCRIEDAGNGRWQRTGERFEDPESGRIVEVHFDPVSGKRWYVQGDDRQSQPRK